MAKAPKKEAAGTPAKPAKELKSWLDAVATYDKVFEPWKERAKKINKRYRDEGRREEDLNESTKFNILWSNTQTLKSATFARLPKPDVSRRFRDNDPVGRVASLILERALDYEVQHYRDYASTLGACVLDRFLPGRGTAWVRYEPKFRAAEQGLPEGGEQPTEDVEAPSAEVLDYECVPCDYVHWEDFGHSVARTWEEVPRVWRKVYMAREALNKRFGEEVAKTIPMDASPRKDQNDQNIAEDEDRACIYEGWDKEKKEAVWFSKGLGDFLDRKPDPLGLAEFFPCPRPMFATLTNDSLVPVPDFALYQDQANQLDALATKIDRLVKALQIRGVYDASVDALKRLFSEANNTDLIPVEKWQQFAEKQGLRGAIDLVDISGIASALISAYQAFDQIKNQIYEITRISDIMRGFVDPDEKLGQSQLKTQYSNLGIKGYQDQVAQFATELLQLKAQIMCNKFEPDTLLALSAADQLNVSDSDVLAVAPQLGIAPPAPQMPAQAPGMPPQQQPAPQPAPIEVMPQEQKKRLVIMAALKLLLGERAVNPEGKGSNPLRSFRVEVAADSLVQMDEEAEKASRNEFLAAQGKFVAEFVAPMFQAPQQILAVLAPVMMEMWKFGTTAFKVGRNIEGTFDEAADKLKELALQGAPQVPPEMIEQMRQQATQQAEAALAEKVLAHDKKVATDEVRINKREALLEIREKGFEASSEIQREAMRERERRGMEQGMQS